MNRATDDPADALASGYRHLQEGRIDQARAIAEALLAVRAEDPHVLVLASEVRLADDDAGTALALLERAIVASGGDGLLRIKKAQLLLRLGQRIDAIRTADAAAGSVAANGEALWRIAGVHAGGNDPAGAVGYFARARDRLGDAPGLFYDQASALFFTGRFDEAEALLDRLLQRMPQAGHAMYLRATLRRQTPERNHVDDLRRRLSAGAFRDAGAHAAALYALAKELEDLGDDDAAFATLTEAAARMRSTLRYDVAQECRTIDAIARTVTAPALAAASPGCDDDGAIFIVGMPRTGTTLVERILGSRGDVASAGELLDFGNALAAAVRGVRAREPGLTAAEASLRIDFAALGAGYMDTARQAAGGSRRFIDKMPVNYLYSGLIQRALPNARILHLVRDPLDTGYAVYKTLFYGAYHFSYDLHEIGAYYAAYHRLMAHWRRTLPDRILDVRYEDLVADPDTQARRILAFCGLAADRPDAGADALASRTFATASAAQVREPLHTRSIGRWRRHAAGLAPLARALEDAGIEVG